MRRFLMLSALSGLLVLPACASRPPEPLTIQIPAPLNEVCPNAGDASDVDSVGELASYSLRQEVALARCEARRAALASLIEGHKQIVAPKRSWWRF
jgi:hypothetical protein